MKGAAFVLDASTILIHLMLFYSIILLPHWTFQPALLRQNVLLDCQLGRESADLRGVGAAEAMRQACQHPDVDVRPPGPCRSRSALSGPECTAVWPPCIAAAAPTNPWVPRVRISRSTFGPRRMFRALIWRCSSLSISTVVTITTYLCCA